MTDTIHYKNADSLEGVYIPKSYQFERDINTEKFEYSREYSEYYDKDANENYTCEDIVTLLNSAKGQKEVLNMIVHFKNIQCKRLDVLDSYSHGKNYGILHGKRRIEKTKADYRIVHDYGGYISRFATSYVISKPITYTYNGSKDDGDTNDLKDIEEINKNNDVDNLNYELAYDCSVFGRAFEFHYRKKNDSCDYIAKIDPRDIFVIRDRTVESKIIASIHCPTYSGLFEPVIYTDDKIYYLNKIDLNKPTLAINNVVKNPYGQVPIVEWWNNRYREGDFEKQIASIDAYDAGQSDTANYMSDLNDALLVIQGDIKDDIGHLEDMKDANILILENGINANGQSIPSSAGYIYKQYDVSGVESYKSRILDDLHMLSGIPKITDESFNTPSGIAMQYKTFGLRQIKETKVNYFSKALKKRYQIIEVMRKRNGGKSIDSKSIGFSFHENLPSDIWLEIKSYIDSGGQVSQETLRENTSFTNPIKEQERMDNEEDRREGLSPEEIAFKRLTTQKSVKDDE